MQLSASQNWEWWWVGVEVEIKGKPVRDLVPAVMGTSLGLGPPPCTWAIFTPWSDSTPAATSGHLRCALEMCCCLACHAPPPPTQGPAPPCLHSQSAFKRSLPGPCIFTTAVHTSISSIRHGTSGGQGLCSRHLLSLIVYIRKLIAGLMNTQR